MTDQAGGKRIINAAMERVSKLYGAGREVGMTEAYDSTFAEQVLAEINRNFPHAVQKSELKYAFENEPSDSALLTAWHVCNATGSSREKRCSQAPAGGEKNSNGRHSDHCSWQEAPSDISAQPPAMPEISTGKSILRDEQRKVSNILIASPSDVVEERAIVESAIHDWNASHSQNGNYAQRN